MKKQWHPLFVHLMRLLVGDWYAVEPEVPVSDLPRRGDLLLVRREGKGEPPFRGLWSNLSELNVIEFKGPTDAPEGEDLELLVAVGSGLTVRLNEQRREAKQPALAARQVAFWYLAPNLGPTFRAEASLRAAFDYQGDGLWRGWAWGHRIWLVSYRDLAVEEDALPLFLVDRQRPAPPGLSTVVMQREQLLVRFASFLMALQPRLWEEVRRMATSPDSIIDWEAVGKVTDLRNVIPALSAKVVVETLGIKNAIDTIGLDRVIEVEGRDRVIEAVGLQAFLEKYGASKILEELRKTMSAEAIQEALRKTEGQ